MPVCRECGKTQASAEMRRSKKEAGTWVCKDTPKCKERVKLAKAERKTG